MIYLILLLGVFASSSAAVLIRLAHAPPLVVAAGRMAVASAILIPIALIRYRGDLSLIVRLHKSPVLLSGVFLGLHFALWITSLYHTSISSSVFLVSTGPIFVAFGSWLFLKEAIGLRTWVATAVSLAGTALLTLMDASYARHTLYGDLLAVGGAATVAAHLLVSRRQRQHLDLIPYITVANTTAALILIAGAYLGGDPLLGYSTSTYGWIVLLAVGPQLLGHGSFNYAVKRVHPAVITLVLLVEPVASSFLAYIILGESPSEWIYIGGLTILLGVALAAWPRKAA